MDVKELELQMLIEELESYEGRATELVSYYVPAGYELSKVIEHLGYEYSTAQNIKDKNTRQHVMDAIAKILNYLKGLKNTPENGLVVFCGNISNVPGKVDLRLWAMEPPDKLSLRIYRCDSKFLLDPLKEMIKPKQIYGLIVLDRGEATIGTLKGSRLIVLENKESWVPSKMRAGGQSSVRFQRLIEQDVHLWLKYLADEMRNFFDKDMDKLAGIIVGGPGLLKERFVNEDYLPYQLKQKVLGVYDTAYSNEYGLKELLEKAKDVLQKTEYTKEVQLANLFFEHLGKNTGLVVYGLDDVKKALELGAIDTIIISEDYKDKLKELLDLIQQTNAKIEIISKNHPEGEQFANFKIGAILRFKIS
ncbi:peptide chain release factor subunit 1 [Nanobdella aerobiophila]|uniref:Peptide chain release factor subunit 1 n=1 Tax=Nanobdella aerobiophila TaxID=2586965 RepID=A0A915SFW6_9ARCH|nr:peptide chain release factor aRF-1 [Nanobdella aerobiophila]BBL45674.1 peptide chain release factor subunit 1 [Nanobdella aerobiophila]